MHCLEFRRSYLIDATVNTVQLSHVTCCTSCAQFALQLARLNVQLSNAFEVPMPEHWGNVCCELQLELLKRERYKTSIIALALLFLVIFLLMYTA